MGIPLGFKEGALPKEFVPGALSAEFKEGALPMGFSEGSLKETLPSPGSDGLISAPTLRGGDFGESITPFKNAAEAVEPAITLGSAMLGGVVGQGAKLADVMTGTGLDYAKKHAATIAESMTYQPRLAESNKALQSAAPLVEALNYPFVKGKELIKEGVTATGDYLRWPEGATKNLAEGIAEGAETAAVLLPAAKAIMVGMSPTKLPKALKAPSVVKQGAQLLLERNATSTKLIQEAYSLPTDILKASGLIVHDRRVGGVRNLHDRIFFSDPATAGGPHNLPSTNVINADFTVPQLEAIVNASRARFSPVLPVFKAVMPKTLKGTIAGLDAAFKEGRGGGAIGAVNAVNTLQERGLSTSSAKQVMRQIKGQNLLIAVQDYQRALKTLTAGAKTGSKVFKNIGVAKLAEDGVFDVLKSAGVTDDSAKVFIEHFAKSSSEPIETLGRLAKTSPSKLSELNLVPGAVEDPFLPPRGALRTKVTEGLEKFLLPKTVMSLDQGALRIHNTALEAQRSIDKARYLFKNDVDAAIKGLSDQQAGAVAHMLNGEKSAVPVTPEMKNAFGSLRRILNTLAGPKWNNLKMKSKYLEDYLPGIFESRKGASADVLRLAAEHLAGSAAKYAALSVREQGRLLDQAYIMLGKPPSQAWFGNISLHRLPETELTNFKLREVMHKYVDGAVRKAYMDKVYDSAQNIIPTIADPDIRNYTMDFLRGFRNVTEGKGGRTFTALRTMQAWAKLGLPNLTAPLQNLTQNANTYAVVGGPTLARATRLRFSTEGKVLLDKSGVFLDVAKHELDDALLTALNSTSTLILYGFNWSERLNREIAWLAGYLKAKDAFPTASFAALNKAGRNLVDRTQFVFNLAGRPAAMRSPAGATLGQFKLFGENQARFISGLKGAEIPRFTASVALLGGTKGLPGASTVIKVLAGIEAVKYLQEKDWPEKAKSFAIGGVPRMLGNWAPQASQDVGAGFLPTDLSQLKSYALSPVGGTLVGAAQGLAGIVQKDPALANKGLTEMVRTAPGGVGIERWRQAYQTSKRGGMKLSPSGSPVRHMTNEEIIQSGLWGGRSLPELQQQEKFESQKKTIDDFNGAVRVLKYELHTATASNDVDRVSEILAKARDAGVLGGFNLGKEFFAPVLLRQFLSAPEAVKNELWKSPQFRKDMLEEADDLSEYAIKAGDVLKAAGERLPMIESQAAEWPYKWEGTLAPKGFKEGAL